MQQGPCPEPQAQRSPLAIPIPQAQGAVKPSVLPTSEMPWRPGGPKYARVYFQGLCWALLQARPLSSKLFHHQVSPGPKGSLLWGRAAQPGRAGTRMRHYPGCLGTDVHGNVAWSQVERDVGAGLGTRSPKP